MPRPGQWVSTSLKIVGAHTTPDGRAIGIYHPAGTRQEPVQDGESVVMKTVRVPESVTIVAPDGQDLYAMVDRVAGPVVFDPKKLPDLKPVLEADHLPESRRAHLPKGHRLAP